MLVGPDNGLLAPAVAMLGGPGRIVALENTQYQLPAPGPTFAGRDIMAPAVAHIANGVPLSVLGDEISAASLAPGILPLPSVDDGMVNGEVLWVDRFGNCQLNIAPEQLLELGAQPGAGLEVRMGETGRRGALGPHVRRRQPVGARADHRLLRQLRARLRPAVGRRAAEAPRGQHRDARAARRGPRARVRWGTSLVLVLLLVLILVAAIIQFVFRF